MSEFHESDEIHDAAGYALNALDPAELAAFEEHLAGCESCQREVAEFAETAAQLALLSEEAPPAALRGSVLASISGVRQLSAEAADEEPADVESVTAEPEAAGPTDAEPEAAGPADVEPVAARVAADDRSTDVPDELAARRSTGTRRRSPVLWLAVAAAMALVLALGGWVWGFSQRQDHQVAVAGASAANRLLSAPDVRTYPVTVDGTSTTFVVSKSLNQAMFVGAALPAAASGRTYQLWTVPAGQAAVPNVTLAGGPNTATFMTGDISAAAALAITNEPAGGSTQPTLPLLGKAVLAS